MKRRITAIQQEEVTVIVFLLIPRKYKKQIINNPDQKKIASEPFQKSFDRAAPIALSHLTECGDVGCLAGDLHDVWVPIASHLRECGDGGSLE